MRKAESTSYERFLILTRPDGDRTLVWKTIFPICGFDRSDLRLAERQSKGNWARGESAFFYNGRRLGNHADWEGSQGWRNCGIIALGITVCS